MSALEEVPGAPLFDRQAGGFAPTHREMLVTAPDFAITGTITGNGAGR